MRVNMIEMFVVVAVVAAVTLNFTIINYCAVPFVFNL